VSRHATYPIGKFQTKVLAAIQETPGLSLHTLGRRLSRQSGQVGNAVISLEKRGLVISKIGLTPDGNTGRLCYPVSA
jgi:DNA-binding MarR family transcriptional regulator